MSYSTAALTALAGMPTEAASTTQLVALRDTTYTKTAADARYVQNMQRGAATSPAKVNQYGANEAPTGCVLTRAWGDPNDNYGVLMTYRPLQIYINGAWRTITG